MNATVSLHHASAQNAQPLAGDLWVDEVGYVPADVMAAYFERWQSESEAQLREYVASYLAKGHRFAAFRLPDGRVQCGWRHVRRRFRDVWGVPDVDAFRALQSATRMFDQIYRAGSDRDFPVMLRPPEGSVPLGLNIESGGQAYDE